jgi:hypothetical protein
MDKDYIKHWMTDELQLAYDFYKEGELTRGRIRLQYG